MKSRSLPFVLFSLLSACQAGAAGYHVSPSGNDANTGLGEAPALAWKTIAKVNKTDFVAGDRIHFEGGKTFTGSLAFSAADKGSAANPIIVDSYGSGRATISSGNDRGLLLTNVQGFEVSNLIFVGAGPTVNNTDGIYVENTSGSVFYDHVYFDNLDVSNYGNAGMKLNGSKKKGFQDVRITRSDFHDNQIAGVSTDGDWVGAEDTFYTHKDLYLARCRFFNNYGDPTYTKKTHSGSGLILSEVDGAIIEYCEAFDNGKFCDFGDGPCGIWAWHANRVTIQHCESHHNQTVTSDGDGFDLDGGVSNSVMQYNYAHDNAGAGFLLCQFSGARPWTSNVVRYNISQNDGRKGSYGGITLEGSDGEVTNCDIYNNTVFTSPSPIRGKGMESAIAAWSDVVNVRVFNNIFMTTGGRPLANFSFKKSGMTFRGNNYYTSGAPLQLWWNEQYYTLADWKSATGQEAGSGFNVDPMLTAAGAGGTLGPKALNTLSAYKLKDGSPMINAAMDLASAYGIDAGSTDFYGNTLPQGAAHDLGAHEFPAGAQSRR